MSLLNSEFCHLHIHDQFSLLDGLGSAEQYIDRAREMGFKHIALTNHGNVDGIIKWQNEAILEDKEPINPILGCEAYIVPDLRWRPEPKSKDNPKPEKEFRYHITLLMKNNESLPAMMQMLSVSNIEGFYHRPRIDCDLLLEYAKHFVIMTGCAAGFPLAPWGEKFLLELRLKTTVYLEVMPHCDFEMQEDMNKKLLDLHKRYQIPMVATNDCHYIKSGDAKLQEILLAIQTKKTWKDPKRWKFDLTNLYLCSADEMLSWFKQQGILSDAEAITAIQNTVKVAEQCNCRVERREVKLPEVIVPKYKDLSEQDALMQLTLDGLESRIQDHPEMIDKENEYYERLLEEMEQIIDLGFPRYFLIVWDLINWCKTQDIMVGPGRGSSGGSLVCYCLGITQVDPLRFGLIFSRFISPGRIDLPDIDMDFEDIKRKDIRAYLESKYGEFNVVGVTTFGRMNGRGVLKDVSRVFDIPPVDVNKAANQILQRNLGDYRSSFALQEAIDNFEDAKEFAETYPDVTDYSLRLENQIKGTGKHAAAMCVASEDLRKGNNIVYARRTRDELMCNWDKYDSEFMGLMKLDVLGLNALTLLNQTRKLIIKRKDIDINFNLIPLDDKETLQSFTNGNGVGVFQFGGLIARRLCQQIGVETFEEVSAINALNRPGCLRGGVTTDYEKRKHGTQNIPKIHPLVDNITAETKGLILYQEQIMYLMYSVGGLTWKNADVLRKIVAKSKGMEMLNEWKQSFIDGCAKKGTLNTEEANKIFDELRHWGSYGFNKSHSVEYALVAYWQMWMKIYYPSEYLAMLLSYGPKDKHEFYIEETRRLNLKIKLPAINISDSVEWRIDLKGNIVAPFSAVKGIGPVAAKEIIKHREKDGDFISFENFERRVPKKKVNKKVKHLLQVVNAFDPDKVISDYKLGELSQYFEFEVSNDPAIKYRSVLKKISKFIKPQGKVVNALKTKRKKGTWGKYENHYYFGKLASLKFGYRGSKAGKSKDSQGIAGTADDVGTAYGNFKDDSDYTVIVFEQKLYLKRKAEIEVASDKWMLIDGSTTNWNGNIFADEVWFGDELLSGDLHGLGVGLAKDINKSKTIDLLTKTYSVFGECNCSLSDEQRSIPSIGDYNIMVVTEKPIDKRNEAEFYGMLGSVGITKDMYYHTSIVKCKYQGAVSQKALQHCSRFLREEIKIIQPYIILAFGNSCLQFFHNQSKGITSYNARCRWNEIFKCWVVPSVNISSIYYQEENIDLVTTSLETFSEKIAILGFQI